LMIVAPDLVDVLVGRKWHGAVRILQILAIAALLQSLTMSVPDILTATGGVGALFRFSILSTVLQVGGFAVGLQWGLIGVAWSYAITNAFLAPLLVGLGLRAVGGSWPAFVRPLVPTAAVTAFMAAPTLALRMWLASLHTASILRLASVATFGVMIYVGVSLWKRRELVADVRNLVATGFNREHAAASSTIG
jgi:teichuronic acid exporter